VLNSTIINSMKKKSFDINEYINNNTDKKNLNAKPNTNPNNIFQANNNNVIGVMKKRNLQETPIKNEKNDGIFNLQNKHMLSSSHNKSIADINNSAMFNSMSESNSNRKEKNEILIDINNNSIKGDRDVLDDFLKDLERYSNEAKNFEKELKENKDKNGDKNKVSSFNNIVNNNSKRTENNVNAIKKDEFIDPFEEFNDFDINNLNQLINELPAVNNSIPHIQEDSDGDEEIEKFARQVKDMNSLMNQRKDNKNRKRKHEDDEDEDDVIQAGGRKPKKHNPKAEYFKKKAMYSKMNKYRQNKKNNFL